MRIRQQFALAVFLVAFAGGPVIAAPPIGKTVQATTTVSASGRTLQRSSPLFFNDVVRSNATGVGQFVFDDGSKLAMGPSATVTINKSIYKGKSAQRTGIQASKGAFRYISGALFRPLTSHPLRHHRHSRHGFRLHHSERAPLSPAYFAAPSVSGARHSTAPATIWSPAAERSAHPQALSTGVDKGLNVREAFPLVANQGRLTSQFRQPGRQCLSRVVQRRNVPAQASVRAVGSISEPPGPTPPGPTPPDPDPTPGPTGMNKGFGNGNEGDGSRSDSDNPGRGHGGPHNPNLQTRSIPIRP